ncbi:predicted protein [Methanosarcina acetivorans C2A]|uniref:Uncharacterized protein n=1 Tax=Methanosarcina acetivorans (strain ATCC 35395 / DSM 2834 / JCM 12185 / C2A) TaxID=188937 RepID=Q8TQ57_METAC|nr:predicted protein [Methanosarcina acetivorans C2A]
MLFGRTASILEALVLQLQGKWESGKEIFFAGYFPGNNVTEPAGPWSWESHGPGLKLEILPAKKVLEEFFGKRKEKAKEFHLYALS